MNQPQLALKPDTEASHSREQMKIVIVGHVDHGKSTLIGRLFHDTDSLPDGKVDEIKALSEKRGMPFEYSFLLDALQAERDQGITIDTTQIWFKTNKRDYVIIDAPGHKEFLKNMVSGAANSEAAVLVIDAAEGVQEQSKRHGYLLSLLGVKQIAVAVNKMDLVDYSEEKFKQIEKEYREYLLGVGVEPTYVIPISAREGDNIVTSSHARHPERAQRVEGSHEKQNKLEGASPRIGRADSGNDEGSNMPWYTGPSILEALDHFQLKPADTELPLRFPVQDVYKFDKRRIIAGRIESGTLRVGDEIMFSPINKVVTVNSIENFNGPELTEVSAGMSVGITLSEQIFAERGNMISHLEQMPVLTNVFKTKLFWLGDSELKEGNRYLLKIGTAEYRAEVKSIDHVVDTDDLKVEGEKGSLKKNNVAEVTFRVKGLASLDNHADNEITGRFVLVDHYRIVGGGIIDVSDADNKRSNVATIKARNLTPSTGEISPMERWLTNGHKGGVMWFSGLSGAGKTTLARALEARLHAKGYLAYVLDGDNIRSGLCSDLSFSDADRSENIRRIGEVAALFADAGVIVITAFISPFKKDRDDARIAAKGEYHSVYIKADVETCAKRDPKGLYEKAKKGEIKDFTGVSSPFEEPDNADLVIDTTEKNIDESVEELVAYVERNLVEPVRELGKEQTQYVGGDI